MSFWVDVHAHLDDRAFQDDLEAVIRRAEAMEIKAIVSAGVSLASSRKTLEIARRYPSVYVSVGVHPQEVKGEKLDLAILEEFLAFPKVVAIGEVGLDYYWDTSYVEEQKSVFLDQVELARRYGLPLVVHSRNAEEEILKILREQAPRIPVIWHCFAGDTELLRKILSQDFYLSLNGIVTYPKATKLREAIASVPLERVFLETDAPYLAPQGKRGLRNEPAFLLTTAYFLAELWKIDVDTLRERLFTNFREVFGKRITDKMGEQELSGTKRGCTI
jgi:TatD DNase family protein